MCGLNNTLVIFNSFAHFHVTNKAQLQSNHLLNITELSFNFFQIENQKLTWNAESKIKSLEKANYKPGGGDVQVRYHCVTSKL